MVDSGGSVLCRYVQQTEYTPFLVICAVLELWSDFIWCDVYPCVVTEVKRYCTMCVILKCR